MKKKAPIDSFGVGTNMGTSIDAPCLDVIYKLSEVTNEEGEFLPVMKLSKGKVTYPGRKQVFRIKDKKGNYLRDIIGLEKEKIRGKPLLVKVMSGGKIIYRLPSLNKARAFLQENLKRFPQSMKEISNGYRYPVVTSPGLKKLRRQLSGQLAKRQ
jgi:nicotinate phosphoribosyltransferase